MTKPIWEVLSELGESVPAEVWEKVGDITDDIDGLHYPALRVWAREARSLLRQYESGFFTDREREDHLRCTAKLLREWPLDE